MVFYQTLSLVLPLTFCFFPLCVLVIFLCFPTYSQSIMTFLTSFRETVAGKWIYFMHNIQHSFRETVAGKWKYFMHNIQHSFRETVAGKWKYFMHNIQHSFDSDLFTREEYDFIRREFGNGNKEQMWIGLSKQTPGTPYTWANGERVRYLPWTLNYTGISKFLYL